MSSHTSDIRWDTVLTTFLIGGTMSFNTHSRDSNLTTHEIQFDTITIPGTWSTSGNTLYVVENHKTKSYYDTATYAISGSRLVLSHSKAGVSDSVVMIRQ